MQGGPGMPQYTSNHLNAMEHLTYEGSLTWTTTICSPIIDLNWKKKSHLAAELTLIFSLAVSGARTVCPQCLPSPSHTQSGQIRTWHVSQNTLAVSSLCS